MRQWPPLSRRHRSGRSPRGARAMPRALRRCRTGPSRARRLATRSHRVRAHLHCERPLAECIGQAPCCAHACCAAVARHASHLRHMCMALHGRPARSRRSRPWSQAPSRLQPSATLGTHSCDCRHQCIIHACGRRSTEGRPSRWGRARGQQAAFAPARRRRCCSGQCRGDESRGSCCRRCPSQVTSGCRDSHGRCCRHGATRRGRTWRRRDASGGRHQRPGPSQ